METDHYPQIIENDPEIITKEVEYAFKNMKNGNAPGSDKLSSKLIKL